MMTERVEEIRRRRQRFEAALTGGGDDESVRVCQDIDWLLTALAQAEREIEKLNAENQADAEARAEYWREKLAQAEREREQAVATLREVRAQQREDYERADAARAEVERLKAECAEGDHGAWEDVYKRLIGIYNRLTNKRWFIGIVRNALQRTIKEHGPITAANQISAEKRLVGSILGEVLKEKSDATTLCSRCAEAEAALAQAEREREIVVEDNIRLMNEVERLKAQIAKIKYLVKGYDDNLAIAIRGVTRAALEDRA